MPNYKIIKNSDQPLPFYNLNEYKNRENKTNSEYNNLHIHDNYTGYKSVVWTPLDIPSINLDHKKLWDIWQAVENKNIKGWANPWFDKYPGLLNDSRNHDYRILLCYDNVKYHEPGHQGTWANWMLKEFPEIVTAVNALPFKSIRWLAFVGRDSHGVGPHYDEPQMMLPGMKKTDPPNVRFRWSKITDWKNEHLYFTRDHGETRIYPMLPPETDAMAYDGTTYEHGADKGYHPTERIQLMPMGILDQKKWYKLLDRSIEKYKDYIITEDHFK